MKIHFIKKSSNSKTGAIPVTYSQRETCPESCPHYKSDCYAEDYYTRMVWDKVALRGGSLADLTRSISALPNGQLWRFNVSGDLPGAGESVDPVALGEIVKANIGKKGFTYTHKKSSEALYWVKQSNLFGFTVNLSADHAGEADILAELEVGPVVCIVPIDNPEKSQTPKGRQIIVCPAQTRENVTCESCGLCQKADRSVIVGFRAHGSRAKITDQKARKVIPLHKVALL